MKKSNAQGKSDDMGMVNLGIFLCRNLGREGNVASLTSSRHNDLFRIQEFINSIIRLLGITFHFLRIFMMDPCVTHVSRYFLIFNRIVTWDNWFLGSVAGSTLTGVGPGG